MSIVVLAVLLDRAAQEVQLAGAPSGPVLAAGALGVAGALRGWFDAADLDRPGKKLARTADALLAHAGAVLAGATTTGAPPTFDGLFALRSDIAIAISHGSVALANADLCVPPSSALFGGLCVVTALAGHLGGPDQVRSGWGTCAALLGSLLAGHAATMLWRQQTAKRDIGATKGELAAALGKLEAESRRLLE